MKISVGARVRTEIRDAKTNRLIKRSPWTKNLVFDQGLNGMAQSVAQGIQATPAKAFTYCQIGSGNNPVQINSGVVTFTQAGTAITASSGFFTAAMVGAILKYGASGSGGFEVYIQSVTNSTNAVAVTAHTQAAGSFGTIWMVQQTGLQTYFNSTNNVRQLANDNQTVFAGANATHQRTFSFAPNGAYNVNEIGYSPLAGNAACVGRIVLGATDSIGATNIYIVVMQLVVTYSPVTPAAVVNVGVNINTAGNAQIESWMVDGVNADGTSGPNIGFQCDSLDNGSNVATIFFFTANYTQFANTSAAAFNPLPANIGSGTQAWAYANTLGVMSLTYVYSFTTTGQNCYGIGIGRSPQSLGFDILFTAPQVLPNGTFAGTVVFQVTYSRTLVN